MNHVPFLLVLLLHGSVRAESHYDQPYLGTWPEIFRRFSAEYLREQAELGLAGKVRRSDVIFLGAAHNLIEITVDRIQFYEADVTVLRMIKGDLDGRRIRLTFTPSATGIEDGAQHVFLVRSAGGKGPSAIDAWYVYPDERNLMRVAGAYNCSKDVGMEVLQHLVSGRHSPTLPAKLLNEYRSNSRGKMYSAVVMATAVAPEVGNDVLVEMISVTEREPFDLRLFCIAAYGLAAKQGDKGLRRLIEKVPQSPGVGRIPESVVFDLIATYGTDNLVPDLTALVRRKPAFAVSAAFALAGMGGSSCRDAIRSFLGDEELVERTETISNGWRTRRRQVSALLKEALSQCGGQASEPPWGSGGFLVVLLLTCVLGGAIFVLVRWIWSLIQTAP